MRPLVRYFFRLSYAPVTLFAAFCALIGMTGMVFVQHATSELLREDAKMMASEWTGYLLSNVPDLVQIAAGDMPSTESMIFFEQAHNLGRVSEFSIYNARGDLKLDSRQLGNTQTFQANIFELKPHLAEALKTRSLAVDFQRGTSNGSPIYFSDAIVPFFDHCNVASWLEIRFYQTTTQYLFLVVSSRTT